MIWTRTKNQVNQLFYALNKCHHSITFEHDISPNEVHFLDTTVYVDNNGALQTKLYKNPTDRHNYLHKRSEHPLPLKDSLAYSQALCIRRICSYEKYLRDNCLELSKNFISRGYKLDKILDQVSRANNIPREQTLKHSEKNEPNRIPFITIYNRTLPPISHILQNTGISSRSTLITRRLCRPTFDGLTTQWKR